MCILFYVCLPGQSWRIKTYIYNGKLRINGPSAVNLHLQVFLCLQIFILLRICKLIGPHAATSTCISYVIALLRSYYSRSGECTPLTVRAAHRSLCCMQQQITCKQRLRLTQPRAKTMQKLLCSVCLFFYVKSLASYWWIIATEVSYRHL